MTELVEEIATDEWFKTISNNREIGSWYITSIAGYRVSKLTLDRIDSLKIVRRCGLLFPLTQIACGLLLTTRVAIDLTKILHALSESTSRAV